MQTKLERELDDLEARVARIERALAEKERLYYFRRKLRGLLTRMHVGGFAP